MCPSHIFTIDIFKYLPKLRYAFKNPDFLRPPYPLKASLKLYSLECSNISGNIEAKIVLTCVLKNKKLQNHLNYLERFQKYVFPFFSKFQTPPYYVLRKSHFDKTPTSM